MNNSQYCRPLFALVLLASASGQAQDNTFASRCEALAREAHFQIGFVDRHINRDDSRTADDLKLLSRSPGNRHHNVLGLTHATPVASFELVPSFSSDADGRVCAVPSVTMKLEFSRLEVYLARELGNTCRKSAVWEHEQEHVSVWRNHLRAGAQLLKPALEKVLARPYYFASREDADRELRPMVEAHVSGLLNCLIAGIDAAHRQIDSPRSYAYVSNMMNKCS